MLFRSYPIDVPNSDKVLGNLYHLLNCGLVMEFNIGELDFQASREGLSYIPETIAAIKAKLEKVNAQLAVRIAEEADKITNTWEKALFLCMKGGSSLWTNAINKYVTDTKFEYVNTQHSWHRTHTFKLDAKVLKDEYNIELRGFSKSRNYNACSNLKANAQYEDSMGTKILNYVWSISMAFETRFVKIGRAHV